MVTTDMTIQEEELDIQTPEQIEEDKKDKKDTNIIVKVSGRNTFAKFKRDSFNIDKLHIDFIQYDKSGKKGDKVKNEVQIYIDIAQFYELCFALTSRGMIKKKIACVKAGKPNEVLFEKKGGTSAIRLKMKNRSRSDGKSESRTFQIKPSSAKDYDFALVATKGAGEENATGLIVPSYKQNEAEATVIIPIAERTLIGVMEKVNVYYQAYMNVMMEQYIAEDKARLKQKLEEANNGY